MRRRAQASLEYVITYGWAFLVVLVVLGALAYFGVLNPSKWVPDDCDLGAQLECVDYQVVVSGVSTTPEIHLLVRNNFGKEISIKSVQVKLENGHSIGSLPPDIGPTVDDECKLGNRCHITAGNTGEVKIFSVNDGGIPVLFKGEKQRHIIEINFSRKDSTTDHTLIGSLYTTTKA